MSSSELIQIQTTVDSASQAAELANQLLDARLAACVQISAPVCSCYRWEGAIQHAEEHVLAIKSTHKAWRRLVRFLTEIHPYAEPQIIALPVVESTSSFAIWVKDQVVDN